MLQHGVDLIDGDAGKPFEKLRERSAICEILEERDDWNPRTPEYPGTVDAPWITLDCGTSRPIDHRENASTRSRQHATGVVHHEPPQGKALRVQFATSSSGLRAL